MHEKQILKALHEHKDEHVSGDHLTSQLGLSTAQLSQEIEKLQEEGYHIDSSPLVIVSLKHLTEFYPTKYREIWPQSTLVMKFTTTVRWIPPTTWPRNWQRRVHPKVPSSPPKASAVVRVGEERNGYLPTVGCG
nr:HTH domain-containing protein [Methanobacterium formicicum]